MENEIYQILKKHKLPLKKREEVLADLLLLFSAVGRSEQLSCKCGLQKRKEGVGFSCIRTDCDANIAT